MTIGIYCIEHISSGKKYIGKSIDIKRRFREHKNSLTNRKNHRNRYLQYAVNKYSIADFAFYILEELVLDEHILQARELYWMDFYCTCDQSFGFNLRRDSSSGMIVHEETRKLHSLRTTGQGNPMFGKTHDAHAREAISMYRTGSKHTTATRSKMSETREGVGNAMFGKNHTEHTKRTIASRISKYHFTQYTLQGDFVFLWLTKSDLEEAGFNSSNIYAVCNGKAKTHKGFVWKKVLKDCSDYPKTLDQTVK